MDFWCAVSGIEIAMWDILGKYYETPIYNLLGGKVRENIKVYANGWASSLDHESLAQDATKIVQKRVSKHLNLILLQDLGKIGQRMKLFLKAVKRVATVREAVGPKIDILVEVHRRLSISKAQIFSKEVEKYNPFWIEEPCISENINAIKSKKLY